MALNRRQFMLSAAVSGTVLGSGRAFAHNEIATGGLGMSYEEFGLMYNELPVGQSFRNFEDYETGAALYVDFGEDDLAQTIWVSGDLNETQASGLVARLCPTDSVELHTFELMAGAGSIARRRQQVLESEYLEMNSGGRTTVITSMILEPNGVEANVTEIWVSLEKGS